MLTTAKADPTVHSLRSTVHLSIDQLPETAILGDVLKALETQLGKKKFIPSLTAQQFNPLWFIAETERNVFLWRRGLSLIHADQFEFWFDLPLLIEKRLQQLSHYSSDNPFDNSDWGDEPCADGNGSQEQEYLTALADLLSNTYEHAHAISQVGSLVREEMGTEVERVVLPAAAR